MGVSAEVRQRIKLATFTALALRSNGFSISQIADSLGMDRLRVLGFLNPKKVKARTAARRAVEAGILKAPAVCESCGEPKKLQKHHADYSKPLDVRWLCQDCHTETHKEPQPA